MTKDIYLSDSERLQLPANIDSKDLQEWKEFFDRAVLLHRHEDTLLNARIQTYLVTTGLLMAAFSQFKDAKYIWIAAILTFIGIVISIAAYNILGRSVKAIAWHQDILVNLERLLISNQRLRLIEGRRRLFQELHGSANANIKTPVNHLLGKWLPILISTLWIQLFLTLLVIQSHTEVVAR